MKKLLSLLLVFTMLLSLCACGEKEAETSLETPPKVEVKQVSVIDHIDITWIGKTKTYTNGTDLAINEFGQISEFKKLYNDYTFEYTEDGQIQKTNILYDDPEKTGFEEYTYEDGKPVSCEYNPNDGFRSLRKTTISTETNENGQITVMTEDNTYTDVEDGSISYDTTKYEYEYDQSGKITNVKYYKNDKQDHTTVISYDENGNMLEYSCIGSSDNSVYLSVKFTYKMVDETMMNIKKIDSFDVVNNFETIINQVL